MRLRNLERCFARDHRNRRHRFQDRSPAVGVHDRLGGLDLLRLLALQIICPGVLRNAHDLVLQCALGLVLGGEDFGFLFDRGLPLGNLRLGLLDIDQRHGDLFPAAPLYAVKAQAVALNLVFTHKLIRAILKVKLYVGCETGHHAKE